MNVGSMFDLAGKVAVVTGGGRGIGRFIVQGLAEAGADVIIASRKIQNCEVAAQEIATLGVQARAVRCDMASETDIESLVDIAVKEFGRIDILVNNAGIAWGAPTLEFPLEQWDRIFAVNVRGVWILTQKVAKLMQDRGGCKIINISSIQASRGTYEEAHPAVAYNPSKAAIENLTKNLAVKLARYNIQVNCIAPGFFRTDMMEYIFQPEMKVMLELLMAQIPMHRYGDEEHIKGVAVFLASHASDYMTGAIIPLDGGLVAL